MRASSFARQALLAAVVLGGIGASIACEGVPFDDERNDRRLVPPLGAIRGTVTYVGPRPCSEKGHIVGNAIILVWNRRNPPPPAGIATSPVNFVAVPGDVLFANERRSVSEQLDCPAEDVSITASAPFAIAPLEGASYVLTAFYDRRGRFWPSFEFRNQPESADLAGGYFDVEDARRNAGEPSYRPVLLPVDVGRVVPGQATDPGVPDYVIGDNGYVADNVPVTIGSRVPFTRPVFHPQAVDRATGRVTDSSERLPTGDASDLSIPVVAMTQDAEIFAPPTTQNDATLAAYQQGFPAVRLTWAVPDAERAAAIDPALPFGLQLPPLPPAGKGGLLLYASGGTIPEHPSIPRLWPQVSFVKLADDPRRQADPQGLVVQGTPEETVVTGRPRRPVVVLQGIPLFGDGVASTIAGPVPTSPSTAALVDHLTVLIRPTVLCFDPRRIDRGGLAVTPHTKGRSSLLSETGERPLFDEDALRANPLVRDVRRGCLPTGRYAMSVVYPNGQSWTVPNEMGACARAEGATSAVSGDPATCIAKPRPVLLSQGVRAVLEIVPAGGTDDTCEDHPVPQECLEL